jgi:23S rRNA (cytidine1920-2'-O)/16S rRNA (cytidine1409-2'-O)-methyltransferase
MRLDIRLSQLYDISRQKAQDALKQQRVTVNGKITVKSSMETDDSDVIEMIVIKSDFVSRAGYKLEEMLEKHTVDVTGLNCIDIGASTGGFTDCLIQRKCKFSHCNRCRHFTVTPETSGRSAYHSHGKYKCQKSSSRAV